MKVGRLAVAPGESPSGIAFDGRASSTFHLPQQDDDHADYLKRQVVGTAAIGTGVDGAAFDDATQLVFASRRRREDIVKEETPENSGPCKPEKLSAARERWRSI